MAIILQHRTTQHSYDSTFCHHFVFFIFLHSFTQTTQKSQKYFYLLCNSKEGSRTVHYSTKSIKRPPRAKRPPTTNRAGRLTRFRESRPTPPTNEDSRLSRQTTSLRNVDETTSCSNLLIGRTRKYMPAFAPTKE